MRVAKSCVRCSDEKPLVWELCVQLFCSANCIKLQTGHVASRGLSNKQGELNGVAYQVFAVVKCMDPYITLSH